MTTMCLLSTRWTQSYILGLQRLKGTMKQLCTIFAMQLAHEATY